jgi:hypothetical protein
MRNIILLFATWWWMTGVSAALANDVYIAQNSQGAGNGTSAVDAVESSFFNTASNWSHSPTSTQIGPGTIIHLCGTISTPLRVCGSGASGKPITILFEPNAAMSASRWPAGLGAIDCENNGFIVIDGGPSGSITAKSQNSTSGVGADGVHCNNVHDVEIKNLTIRNIYAKTAYNDTAEHAAAAISVQYGSNILVHHNVVSQAGTGIWYGYDGGASSRNVSLYRNTIASCNWGIASGSGGPNAVLDNFQIHDNDITGPGTQWDDPQDAHHHNGIYVWAEKTGARITNLKIYNNYLHGSWGVNNTACVFISDEASPGGIANPLIYNNVFHTQNGNSNGCLCLVTSSRAFNNTIVCPSFDSNLIGIMLFSRTGSSGGAVIENNIIYNFGNAIYTNVAVTQNNNLVNTDPRFVNFPGDYHLTTSSSAVRRGVDLSAYFTTDIDGSARPRGSAWSIGAFEFTGSKRPDGHRPRSGG